MVYKFYKAILRKLENILIYKSSFYNKLGKILLSTNKMFYIFMITHSTLHQACGIEKYVINNIL